MNQHETLLIEALIDYVRRYGLTRKAKDAFRQLDKDQIAAPKTDAGLEMDEPNFH